MNRLFVSDLDGTFLNSESEIPEKNLAAVKLCKDKGIPFVCCSARSPQGMKTVLDKLDYPCVYSAFGGALTLNERGETIDSITMDRQETFKIFRYIKQRWNVECFVYERDNWYVEKVTDIVRWESNIVKIQPIVCDQQRIVKNNDIYKLLYYVPDEDVLKEMLTTLPRMFCEFSFAKSSGFYLEVTDAAADKGRAVRVALAYYGADSSRCVAFGDNFNDLPMAEAGTFVAVANAPRQVRDKADEVCCSNNDGGVGEYIIGMSGR